MSSFQTKTVSEEITDLPLGTSLSLRLGTAVPFRNDGDMPLTIVGFDSSTWPGNHEDFRGEGAWAPTLPN
jgi:mannose-6-phosphate isomerase-like protein (cupin superfamily)